MTTGGINSSCSFGKINSVCVIMCLLPSSGGFNTLQELCQPFFLFYFLTNQCNVFFLLQSKVKSSSESEASVLHLCPTLKLVDESSSWASSLHLKLSDLRDEQKNRWSALIPIINHLLSQSESRWFGITQQVLTFISSSSSSRSSDDMIHQKKMRRTSSSSADSTFIIFSVSKWNLTF